MPGKPGRPRKYPISEPLRTSEPAVIETESVERLDIDPSDREESRQARGDTKREGTGREKRKPLGVPVQRLQADVPTGMTGRWMNDTPGRIQRALDGGYQFIGDNEEVVQDRSGARSEIVGTGRDGGAMKAYLMAIPAVLYEQDQAAKASLIKAGSDAIQSGKPQTAAPQDQDAFYTPSEGISLRENVTSSR